MVNKEWISVLGTTILLVTAGCQYDKEAPSENNQEVVEKEEGVTELVSLQESSLYKMLEDKQIEHVHGIGYPGNRNELFIATHNGPIVYHNNSWYEATANKNDYMGFTAVSDGFYSSGHPGKGSDLPNPLGLIKSSDRGKTLQELGFQGESDFHYLAIGYETHAIYAVNQQKNSKMDMGVYYSEDAKEWKKVQLNGTPDQVGGIYTHPRNSNVLAITSPMGLYVSNDQGNSFERVTEEIGISTVVFLEDKLIYAEQSPNNQLVIQDLSNGEEKEILMPENEVETIDYLAINPQDEKEIVFHTINETIYRTTDSGETWNILVEQGQVVK
ncbi:F510_1955 family glycosylhydrolase [Pseudalkalibacillus hwajinpoensis]|uniref:F510_1955 family glycosylhydrolase n=1 Tax=Guptibacillus hwajinpoensis TaxID=208199 RepID=UPI00325B1038